MINDSIFYEMIPLKMWGGKVVVKRNDMNHPQRIRASGIRT